MSRKWRWRRFGAPARCKTAAAVPALARLLQHSEAPMRLGARCNALAEIGTPGAMQHLERGLDDEDRDVRIAAVRALGDAEHPPAVQKIEAAIKGRRLQDGDLTEKMAFFEAFGALSGEAGVRHARWAAEQEGAVREEGGRARCGRAPRWRWAASEPIPRWLRCDARVRTRTSSCVTRSAARCEGTGGMTDSRMRMPTPSHRRGTRETSSQSESFIRRAGRTLIVSVYGAMRVIRLYPPENEAVRNALNDLVQAGKTLLDEDKELELRTSGEFIFVNSTRLRLDLDNYASFSHLLSVLRKCGVGTIHVAPEADVARLAGAAFATAVRSAHQAKTSSCTTSAEKLEAAGVTTFDARAAARHG